MHLHHHTSQLWCQCYMFIAVLLQFLVIETLCMSKLLAPLVCLPVWVACCLSDTVCCWWVHGWRLHVWIACCLVFCLLLGWNYCTIGLKVWKCLPLRIYYCIDATSLPACSSGWHCYITGTSTTQPTLNQSVNTNIWTKPSGNQKQMQHSIPIAHQRWTHHVTTELAIY